MASAQDGVFVDPDSPSGKEYVIPIEGARRQANPGSGTSERRDTPAPLFGAGIVRDDPSKAAGRATSAGRVVESGTRSRGRAGARSSDVADARSGSRKPGTEAARLGVTRPGAPEGGFGSALGILALAVLVLTAGGLGGFLARRRMHRD